MSMLLHRLGRTCFRLGWRVLVGWLAILAAVAALGLTIGEGTDDSISIPGVESTEALDTLSQVFPAAAGASAQTLVSLPDGMTVDDPEVRSAIEDAAQRQSGADQVAAVISPYDEMSEGAVTQDRSSAILVAQYEVQENLVTDDSREQLDATAGGLRESLPDGAEVHVGGTAFADMVPTPGAQEAVGVVLAFLVLLLLFRSLRTSLVPLATALTGVAIAEMVIQAGTAGVDIMSTAPMLAMMIGLAVGIDYALFILSRYRDELHEGETPEDAAALATATAGSAVVFAGAVVVIALLGLFLAGIPFLTVMGVAAAFAVVIAVCVSVTAIPALLRYLGDRPARRRPRRDGRRARREPVSARWVGMVTRRPVATLIAGLMIIAALAAPAMTMQLSLPGNGSQPAGSQARETYDAVSEEFGEGYNGPLFVTVNLLDSTDPVADMERLGDDLAGVEGVQNVSMATPEPSGALGLVQLVPETAPDTVETADLVDRLRAEADRVEEQYPFRDYSVTGFTAVQVDVSEMLGGAILPFGIFVVGLSLVLLVMVFRSIVVPIKAAVGYLLSLGASLGVTSLVFVVGFGADLLDVPRTGSVVSFLPIIVMAVLFGLAMDYEVFLVSRMAEARVKGRPPLAAVREGFQQSAPVVTAAALIMISVFVAFVPQEDPTIKPIALALAVGVAVDAFLVRMTLVPAVLALLGRRAWQLPGWLEHRLPVFDVEGETVSHQLRLQDWPRDHPDARVSVENLVIRNPSGTRVAGAGGFHVGPGEIAVLVGDDPGAARTTLAALSGRLGGFSGDVKVAGLVLPHEARTLRTRVPVLTPDAGDAAATDTTAAAIGYTEVAFVDGLDRVVEGSGELTATVRAHLAGGGCVVATAEKPELVAPAFPEAASRTVDVSPRTDDDPGAHAGEQTKESEHHA